MREYLLADAMTNLDNRIVNEYYILKSKYQKRSKNAFLFKNSSKGWMTLAACFTIVLVGVLVLICMKQEKPGSIQIPDKSVGFELGETCENKNWSGTTHSICFNNVFIKDSMVGKEGRFIVFEGTINSTEFSFKTKDSRFGIFAITNERVDERLMQGGKFEEDLSRQLSKAELILDGQKGEMKGEISLVFSIPENAYNVLLNEIVSHNSDNDSDLTIVLEPEVYWGGGPCLFFFKSADLNYSNNNK